MAKMYTYSCLKQTQYHEGAYTFLPLRLSDMEKIRNWRNEQIEVLRQREPITSEQQHNYYQKVIAPSFAEEYPEQILFSFIKQDICIGYGGLTHIDWGNSHAEVSFLVETQRTLIPEAYIQDFLAFLKLLQQVAFSDLQLHRLFAETFSFRTVHIAGLERAGFHLEGKLQEHVFKQGQWWDSLMHGLLRKVNET